jgi:acyl phosphate:glycerol-3-phosphate acyltransferase
MDIIIAIGMILLAYFLGSIPFGMIIVRLSTGKDIRQVESGRTGGTNAMRAAGFWAGAATGVMDLLKGSAAVWLARTVMPGAPWVHVLAGLAAILGHNYSFFLLERDEQGQVRFRGGAGGATTAGGAMGLWFPSVLIIIPVSVVILFGVGYASVTTMSIALIATLIFAYRAWIGASPWQYIFYGVLAELILMWALRPNIRRLRQGTERMVGWRAKRRSQS